MDCNLLGSSVLGILQARILEWVAMLSRGSSIPRNQTCVSCITRGFFPTESPGKPRTADRNSNFFFLNESNIRDLWDDIKHANLCITGILETEETEKGIENVFEEIIANNFPKLKKKTDIQI